MLRFPTCSFTRLIRGSSESIKIKFPRSIGKSSLPALHDLKHSVNCWALPLDLDGEDGEQDNLDRGTGCIPKRTRHSEAISDVGRLQEGGRPRPFGHNVGGSEARRNRASGSGEGLGVVSRLLRRSNVPVGEIHHARGKAGKNGPHAENDEPAQSNRERGGATEEIALPIVAHSIEAYEACRTVRVRVRVRERLRERERESIHPQNKVVAVNSH